LSLLNTFRTFQVVLIHTILLDNINAKKESPDALLEADRGVSLDVNTEKTK